MWTSTSALWPPHTGSVLFGFSDGPTDRLTRPICFQGIITGSATRGSIPFCIHSPSKEPSAILNDDQNHQKWTLVHSSNIIRHHIVACVLTGRTHTFHCHPSTSTNFRWSVITSHCEFAIMFHVNYKWSHRQMTVSIVIRKDR